MSIEGFESIKLTGRNWRQYFLHESRTISKTTAEVALLRGVFTIRSGRKSNYYLDKYHPRSVKNRRRGKKQFLISDAQPIYRKKLVPSRIGV
jgi:hypothetical protein